MVDEIPGNLETIPVQINNDTKQTSWFYYFYILCCVITHLRQKLMLTNVWTEINATLFYKRDIYFILHYRF